MVGTELKRVDAVVNGRAARQHHHAAARALAPKVSQHFKTVAIRKLAIQQHHVGPQGLRERIKLTNGSSYGYLIVVGLQIFHHIRPQGDYIFQYYD